MSKNPANATFAQPAKGTGKSSTAKNPGKASFVQKDGTAGKKTSAKNKSNVSFAQTPKKGSGAKTTAKNPANASFVQPRPEGGKLSKLKAEAKNVGTGAKTKPSANVAPPATGGKLKMKSMDDVVKYRKQKYGA